MTSTMTDKWLDDQVQERKDRKGLLSEAIAAGIKYRLRRNPTGEALKEAVRKSLAGEYDPQYGEDKRWAQKFPKEKLTRLDRLGAAATEILHLEMEDLLQDPKPDDEDWRLHMLFLLRDRDDLEGVRILLEEAGSGVRIRTPLEDLDEYGRKMIIAMPIWFGGQRDEQLTRAVSCNPDGWWTEPVDWPIRACSCGSGISEADCDCSAGIPF